MTQRSTTTEKILTSASALFFESGFGNVSVDTIATAAGTTKVTIYQHFRSKEAIFIACLNARLSARDAALALRFDNQPTTPAVLLEFFDWMQATVSHNRYRGCAFVKAYNELSETLPEVQQIARRAKHGLREKIITVATRCNVSEPEELGAQLAVLLEGAQTLSFVAHSRRPFKAARAAAIKLLLADGWNPSSKCLQLHQEKCR